VKAEIGIRKSSVRTSIAHVAPLSTPFVLFVDPSSACNFACTFCPTGDHKLIKSIGRFQGTLQMEDFEKIMTDAEEFDSTFKVLRLYKDGEPLVNKRLSQMIRLAKSTGRFEKIDTTTNGALLTHERSEDLIDSGIDLINVSVDGLDANQFSLFAKARVDFEQFVENLSYLYKIRSGCKIVIKTTSEIIGDHRHQEFLDIFGNICDKIYIENTSPCWPNFDVEERMNIEITEGLYGNEIVEQTACPYLFYSISVNSDMKVSACFVDWSRSLIVGNLRESSLKEIWNSTEMNTHRFAHLSGKRKQNATCGGCKQISHCGPDSIEDQIHEIRTKYQSVGLFEVTEHDLERSGYHLKNLPIV
jgi:radical SAM protein with 4Fe4S-binding SPASM domain